MSISASEVSKVASLARLALADGEREKLLHELNAILSYIDALNTVSLQNTEIMVHPFEQAETPLRVDSILESEENRKAFTETLIAGSPVREGQFFKVPKMTKT